MALSISYWFNAILLALYIRFSHTCKATWKGFSRDALHHVPQFLKLAGSSALMLWWVLSVLLRHSLILVSYLCVHSLLSSFCLTWKFC
jgi:MATE family multidrug resistance protein